MINCKGCKYEKNYDICRCKECGGIGSDEFRGSLTIFNKLILKKYADAYNFTIEEVEAKCKDVLEIMKMYKYYEEVDCIKFIEASLNIKIRDKGRNR